MPTWTEDQPPFDLPRYRTERGREQYILPTHYSDERPSFIERAILLVCCATIFGVVAYFMLLTLMRGG